MQGKALRDGFLNLSTNDLGLDNFFVVGAAHCIVGQ